jgi:hypothetical protein
MYCKWINVTSNDNTISDSAEYREALIIYIYLYISRIGLGVVRTHL